MKKRVTSFLMAAVMALTSVPTVGAIGGFEFMKEVQNALPAQSGTFLDETPALPAVGGTNFIKKLSGDLPEVRQDGFLAEPTAPLKTFPGTGELLAEISAPDENAIEIDSADALAQVISGGSYVLTADIDLSEVDWESQSQSYSSPKDITLDGQGHTISGLTGSADQYSSGLFGIVYGNLTARNLILRDFSLERGPVSGGSPRAGALAAWADKGLTLENCVLDGFSLTASDTGVSLESVGGFVGYAYGGSNCVLRDCAVRGTIDLSAGEDASLYCKFAGGMIGSLKCRGIQMTDCLSEMDMNFGACSVYYPGGLIGEIENQGTTDFLRCVSSGDVSGDALNSFSGFAKIRDPYMSYKPITFTDCLYDGSCIVETNESGDLYFGGFVGELNSRSITLDNCRFEGEIDAGMECAGGLIGYVQDKDENTVIRNCLADGVIRTSGSRAGGLVGMLSNVFTMEGCLASGTLTMDEGDKLSTSMGGLIGDCYGRNSPVIRCVSKGDVTARFAGGLVGNIRDSGLYQPVLFTDCKNTGTITGEYQTTSTSGGQYSAAGGLFGRGIGSFTNCVAGGTITGDRAGGLLGEAREYLKQQSESAFTDCRASCTLGGGIAGGLLGAIYENGGGSYATFTNCASDAELITDESADQVFGGLMGEGQGDFERCQAELDLAHTGDMKLTAGGLLGENIGELIIWDCSTDFTMDDRSSIGGIFGGILGNGGEFSDYDMMITNCVSEVDIETEATTTAGGLAGIGGGIMTRCTAAGAITSNGGALGGLCGRTGDLTMGECCTSVELHIESIAQTLTSGTCMGGLVGSGGQSTIYSCWSDADLTYDANEYGGLGGLIGQSNSLAMQDCCFLGSIGDHLGEYCGGIVGYVAFGSLIRNCYAQAEISGSGWDLENCANEILSHVGGIAGCVGGTIRDCYFKGSVENQGDTVGGIVGHDSYDTSLSVENCEVTGTVTGRIAGGIAGKIGGTVRDCTFDGQVCIDSVDEDEKYGDDHILGGIAAEATGTIIGCEVKQPQRISKSFTLNGGSVFYMPTVRFGGIAANHTGEIADCVTQGASVIVTNAGSLAVGGITAYGKQLHPVNVSYTEDIYYMDNCTVNGNVTASLTGHFPAELLSSEAVQVGGILGGAYKTAKLGGCTMNGSVTGTLSRSHDEMKYSLTAGGLAGSVQHLYLDASEFTGVLVYSPGLGNDGRYLPLLGNGVIEGASAPEVELPEREEEDYKVTVYGYTMQDLNGYLLEDAAITVDGKGLGQTDALGEFGFSSEDVGTNGVVVVGASHKDYFESSRHVYLADEGELVFWLKKKEPGQIYFKTVQAQGETLHNLLNRLDHLTLLQQDTNPRPVKVVVDWNDIEEEGRELYLINGKGNTKYNLNDNSVNNIRFTSVFKPGEEIYIVAKGTYEGKTVETKEKLALSIRQIPIKLPVEKGKQQVGASGEADEDTNLYFLQGLNLDMGFGSMVPFATDISVLNEMLKVQFTWKSGETDQIDVWKTGTMSHGVDVFVEGTIKVPITDTMDGEWTGDLTFGINQMPEMNFDERVTIKGTLKDLDYPGVIKINFPLPLPVPSYFETQIGVGGSGSLNFYGPFNKVNVAGKTTVTGYGLIGIGLGGEVNDNLEIKVGGEGELRPEISMVHDPMAGNPLSFDPKIDGAVSAKASLKAYIIGGEVKLKLGGFSWDKEKLQWFLLDEEGEETAALADETFDSDWQAVSRAYLENGGGFHTQNASLWDFNTAENAEVRYENIALTADTALAVNSAGNAVLYYTADDESAGTNGTVAAHTALWMSERNAETGAWSKPVKLSAADSYPALPHANGDYVIWVESEETDSLDGMLTSSVIKLAKNGTVVATYDPGCYVYDPQVAASWNGSEAVVSWVEDENVSGTNIMGGTPELCYALFNGSTIGRPERKTDASKATLSYDSASYAVYRYCSEVGMLRRNWDTIVSAKLHRYATDGTTTANFDENGALTIYNRNTAVKTLDTSFCQNSTPVLVTDPNNGQKYLFWAETGGIRYMKSTDDSNWGEPLLLTATDAPAMQLAAAIDPNGVPHISWLENSVHADGERTDLYTMTLNTTAIDLVLEQISYDEDHLLNTGEVKLEGMVYNNSLTDAEGLQVNITDENGKTVYTNTFDRVTAAGGRARFYAVFAPDGKSAHTYTVSVTPIVDQVTMTDADASDNTLEVGVAAGEGEIVQLGFVRTSASADVALEAFVRNTGGASADKMTVTVIDANGETVVEEIFEDVPIGSTRQVLLKNIAANERYTVAVTTGSDETDRQTALYTDPDAPFLKISSMEMDRNSVELVLLGQGQTEGASRVLLALYQNGKMRYAAEDTTESLNGSSAMEFAFDEPMAKGEYGYKLFFLADGGTFAPLAAVRSGKLSVE